MHSYYTLHWWVISKCRPNSQNDIICPWNVLNIKKLRGTHYKPDQHGWCILIIICQAKLNSWNMKLFFPKNLVWFSKSRSDMSMSSVLIVISPWANCLFLETVLLLPYFTTPTYYCTRSYNIEQRLETKGSSNSSQPHVIEDHIQFGLHYCPSLLTATLLSCPLHFLTSICVSMGHYPNWALSIVFGKPLLFNWTRKRLKKYGDGVGQTCRRGSGEVDGRAVVRLHGEMWRSAGKQTITLKTLSLRQ